MSSDQRHQKHLSSYLKSKKESPVKTSPASRLSNKSSKLQGKSPNRLNLSKPHGQASHTRDGIVTRSRSSHAQSLNRLPDELLITILKFLSPSQLLICAQVCHRWAILTTDSSLWEGIFPHIPQDVRKLFKFEETRKEGFNWRKEMIQRNIKARNNIVYGHIKRPPVYYGMPDPQGHFKFLATRWKLCFVDTSGSEHWVSGGKMLYFFSSVSLHWLSLDLPPLPRIKTMRLFAFVPVFFNKGWSKPHVRSATTRHLIMEHNMKSSENVVKQNSAVAEDDMITTHILPQGTILAIWKASWKDGGELAYVNINIPHYNLINRILLASYRQIYREPSHKPYYDDIDPRYGLHGYVADIHLRDNACPFWSQHYRALDRGYMSGDCIVLGDIGAPLGSWLHPMPGYKPVLPWKTELFSGTLKNACLLDLRIVDEHKKPFWCVSSLAAVILNPQPDVDYSENGQKYTIDYSDDKGMVHIDLVWDPEVDRIMVIRVLFHIRKVFINQWFGTKH